MYDTINTSDFGGSVHKYYGKSKIDDNKSIISTNIGTIYDSILSYLSIEPVINDNSIILTTVCSYEVDSLGENEFLRYFDSDTPDVFKGTDTEYLSNGKWVSKRPKTYSKWRSVFKVRFAVIREVSYAGIPLSSDTDKAVVVALDTTLGIKFGYSVCHDDDKFSLTNGIQMSLEKILHGDNTPPKSTHIDDKCKKAIYEAIGILYMKN